MKTFTKVDRVSDSQQQTPRRSTRNTVKNHCISQEKKLIIPDSNQETMANNNLLEVKRRGRKRKQTTGDNNANPEKRKNNTNEKRSSSEEILIFDTVSSRKKPDAKNRKTTDKLNEQKPQVQNFRINYLKSRVSRIHTKSRPSKSPQKSKSHSPSMSVASVRVNSVTPKRKRMKLTNKNVRF